MELTDAVERARARKRVANMTPDQRARKKEARQRYYRSLSAEKKAAINARKRALLREVPAGAERRRYNSTPLRSELPLGRLLALRAKDRERQSRMSAQEAADALALQQGKCAICAVELSSLPAKKVCADHCHTSGRARGLLCSKCNTGLGLFSDSIEILEAAIAYLRSPPLRIL